MQGFLDFIQSMYVYHILYKADWDSAVYLFVTKNLYNYFGDLGVYRFRRGDDTFVG